MKKLISLVCYTCFFLVFFTSIQAADDKTAFNSEQTAQIETIIHNYLLKNPQVLLEAAQKLQEQDNAKTNAKIEEIKAKIPKYKNQIFSLTAPGRTFIGNPNAKILLVEVLQYQCSHCQVVEPIVEKLLKANPDIGLIIMQWPFFGADAIYASKAALAAQKQGKFAELNTAFLSSHELLNAEKIDAIIKSISGLNVDKLKKDMQDKSLDDGLKANFKLSQDLGFIGTPTLVFADRALTKFSLLAGQTPDVEGDLNNALKQVR